MATTAACSNLEDACVRGVFEGLANRTDCYGVYAADGATHTEKTTLTEEVVRRHFRGDITIGLHTTSLDNTCRWVAWDIDAHGDTDETRANANLETARALIEALQALNLEPLLEDSNGTGGFHVWLFLDRPVATHAAYAFAKGMAPEGVEAFPKQRRIDPDPGARRGHYGNYIRLPGRHHKRPHWSRLKLGGEFVDWPDCVEMLVDPPRSPASVIEGCAEDQAASGKSKRRGKRSGAAGSTREPEGLDDIRRLHTREVLLAANALLRLAPARAREYEAWIRVGMALHAVDPSPLMVAIWDAWSSQCEAKWESGACAAKWETFGDCEDGLGLGSLLHWVREDSAARPEDRAARLEELNAILSSGGREISIARIVRRGRVHATVDIEMADGTVVEVGPLAHLRKFDRVASAIAEAARVVLPKKLAKGWDDVAQLMIDCMEEVEGESIGDQIDEFLEGILAADPPINADDDEELNDLLASRRQAFFRREGRLYVRPDVLMRLNRRQGVLDIKQRDLGDELARMGWGFCRLSFGSRTTQRRLRVYAAPQGWEQ